MDILLIIIWALLCIIGIIGSVLPVLPGPLLSFIGLLLLQLTSTHPFGWTFFIVWALIIIFLTVLDYIIPARGTKKFGGTKAGVRGSNIWLIISVVVLPIFGIVIWPFGLLGLIAWPFLWAYIGEKITGKHHDHALRSAIGSFVWFLAWSFLKIVVTIIMAGYFFVNIYKILVK